MVRTIAVVALLTLFASVGTPVWAPVHEQPEAPAEPLARLVPRNVDLFISVRNCDHFISSLRDGKLGEPLRELGLAELLRQVLPDRDGEGVEAEFAFALGEIGGDDFIPDFYFLAQVEGVDFDEYVGEMVDEIVESLQAAGIDYEIEEQDEFTVYAFEVMGQPLFSVLTAGDRMALATLDGADAILELAEDGDDDESFAGTDAFEALNRAAEEGDAEAMTYVRSEPILRLIRAALSARQLLGEPGALETLFSWLVELPGIDLVEGAGASVSLSADEKVGGEVTIQLSDR